MIVGESTEGSFTSNLFIVSSADFAAFNWVSKYSKNLKKKFEAKVIKEIESNLFGLYLL